MSNTETANRGRGRPKLDISRRLEQKLLSEGVARTAFGPRNGDVSEINARMRLYNAAKRVGLRISTEKVVQGGLKLMVGRVVEG